MNEDQTSSNNINSKNDLKPPTPQPQNPPSSPQALIDPGANSVPPLNAVDSPRTKMPKRKKLIIAVVLLILLVGLSAFGLFILNSKETKDSQSPISLPVCKVTGDIEHCLEVDKSKASITEILNFTSVVKNVGDKTIDKQFPCTDNGPALYINGQFNTEDGICLTAISNVKLQPGESKTYDYKLRAAALKLGENEVYAEWSGASSKAVKITLSINIKDQASSEKCTESKNVVKSCAQIMGIFSEGTTPEQASTIFQKYDLTLITQLSYESPTYNRTPGDDKFVCKKGKGSPAYSEELGFYTANVPFDKLAKTIQLLKSDPNIESADESPGGLVTSPKPIPCDDSRNF